MAEAGGVKKLAQHTDEKGGRAPSSDYLQRLMEAGVDVPYLFTDHRLGRSLSGPAPVPAGADDAILVPLMADKGSTGAGNVVLYEDVILERVPFARRWLAANLPNSRPGALKLLQSYGDSMDGTLFSGDLSLVDTDCVVVDIDGSYLLQANDQLFFKRVTRKMKGQHEVISDNPNVRTVEVLDGTH